MKIEYRHRSCGAWLLRLLRLLLSLARLCARRASRRRSLGGRACHGNRRRTSGCIRVLITSRLCACLALARLPCLTWLACLTCLPCLTWLARLARLARLTDRTASGSSSTGTLCAPHLVVKLSAELCDLSLRLEVLGGAAGVDLEGVPETGEAVLVSSLFRLGEVQVVHVAGPEDLTLLASLRCSWTCLASWSGLARLPCGVHRDEASIIRGGRDVGLRFTWVEGRRLL